jgi:hypothetical protein
MSTTEIATSCGSSGFKGALIIGAASFIVGALWGSWVHWAHGKTLLRGRP